MFELAKKSIPPHDISPDLLLYQGNITTLWKPMLLQSQSKLDLTSSALLTTTDFFLYGIHCFLSNVGMQDFSPDKHPGMRLIPGPLVHMTKPPFRASSNLE